MTHLLIWILRLLIRLCCLEHLLQFRISFRNLSDEGFELSFVKFYVFTQFLYFFQFCLFFIF